MSEIKMVILKDNMFSLMTKIAFIELRGNKVALHNFYTNEVEWIGEGEMIPDRCVLKIPYLIAEDTLKAIANSLNEAGIKPESEHKVHGLLEAQSRHLEDLRTMLKLKRGEK